MIDLNDAVERLTYLRKPNRAAEKHGEGLFLPVPRKGEEVEIRGSYLRYVSMPGQAPHQDDTAEGVSRRKHWDKMRRKVAANARMK